MKRAQKKACIIGSRITIITGEYQRPKTLATLQIPPVPKIQRFSTSKFSTTNGFLAIINCYKMKYSLQWFYCIFTANILFMHIAIAYCFFFYWYLQILQIFGYSVHWAPASKLAKINQVVNFNLILKLF